MNRHASTVIASLFVGSFLMIGCGSAGSTSEPQPGASVSTAAQPVLVVPATGSSVAHGIATWKVYAESGGLRAVDVDSAGNELDALSIHGDAKSGTTIQDLTSGGEVRLDGSGQIAEDTFVDSDRSRNVMSDLHTDMAGYMAAHPNDVGYACESAIGWALAACSLVYPACVGTFGLGCISASLTCARLSQQAYNCLNGATN
jgi:hypothetical protein